MRGENEVGNGVKRPMIIRKCDEVGERTWNRFAGVVRSVPAVDAIPVVRIDAGDFEQCSTCKVGREGDEMKTTSIENTPKK